MLVTNKFLLQKANKGNYAVGAFNINNMEFLQAIINAAEKLKSPAIVQTTEGAIKYAGLVYLHSLVSTAAKYTKIPISFHLDHGRDLDIIKQCIKIGYTSVMIDGSHYDFEKNIRVTKKVVGLAHKKRVSVEAELGTIGGVEEDVSARKIIYTEPDAALEFVKRTGVDTLAVAIGTSHGAYKFAGKSKLDIKRLKAIKKKVKIPLVLHGGSGIPADIISKAKKYGAKFGKPKGVSDSETKKAVRNGINKVNIDSDLRLSFTAAVREVFGKKPEEFDSRKILGPARAFVQKTVEHKMKLFGSAGKI